MNRRGFLKGLALLGVSTLVADKLIALAEDPLPAVIPTTLAQFRPPADIYWLQDLHIVGCEDTHRPVQFGLGRAGGDPLLQFGLSTYGGMIRWRAMPGEEIVATRAHPLNIHGNFDGAAYAYGRTEKGFMMHEFILTRGEGTIGRVLQLEKPTAMLRLSAA